MHRPPSHSSPCYCLIVVLFAGCQQAVKDENSTQATKTESAHDSAEVGNHETVEVGVAHGIASTPTDNGVTELDTASVRLEVVDIERYREVLVEHQGQVVLVDFWATWCPTCLELFPHTVELEKSHAEKGLAVISVSHDAVESEDQVLAFLRSRGASFVNLLSQYGAGTESGKQFEIVGGGVPFYKLYDRTGELRHQFSAVPTGGVEELDAIDARVAELLAE